MSDLKVEKSNTNINDDSISSPNGITNKLDSKLITINSSDSEFNINSEHNRGCLGSCFSNLDNLDKRLSAYIFEFEPNQDTFCGLIIDLISFIGGFSFTYFCLPFYVILYIILFRSYVYGIVVLFNLIVTHILKSIFCRKRPISIANNYDFKYGRFGKLMSCEHVSTKYVNMHIIDTHIYIYINVRNN